MFHVLVIIVNRIIKKPIHALIILFVIIFFTSQVMLLAKSSVEENNFSVIKNLNMCFKHPHIDPNKKYVIMRIDDIQAYYLRDVGMKMIDEGISRHIPFTLGVIPMNINTDNVIVNYLTSNKCNLEIALHGFNNRQDMPEFKDLSKEEASLKIEAGIKELKSIEENQLHTFIPPDNVYDTGTIEAAKSKNFKIISSEGKGLFDYTVSTYFFDKKQLNDINSIMSEVNADTKEKGFAIIMIHPQDYVNDIGKIDEQKYAKYIELLDRLKSEGYSFTTMKDYYDYIKKEGVKTDFFDSSVDIEKFNIENQDVLNKRKG